jgi:hypothetical protein
MCVILSRILLKVDGFSANLDAFPCRAATIELTTQHLTVLIKMNRQTTLT